MNGDVRILIRSTVVSTFCACVVEMYHSQNVGEYLTVAKIRFLIIENWGH